MSDDYFDAIVVGSGATGGWAAKQLTEGGLRVLLLEAGSLFEHFRVRSGATTFAERRPIQSLHGLCNENTYQLFIDDIDNPYSTEPGNPYYWIRARQLGGRLRSWGRVCLRFSNRQFRAASHDGYGDDWPIEYEELAPFYDEVETFLGVAGGLDGIPDLPDGKFRPPLTINCDGVRHLSLAAARLPDACLISGRVALARPDVMLAAAARTQRLTLRSNSIVSRVIPDRSRARAKGVGYFDCTTGEAFEAYARVVVLCGSTIESTRIMLNSAPGGLANSSGVLGHYLMDHLMTPMSGVMPETVRPLVDRDDLAGRCLIPPFRNIKERGPFLRTYSIDCNVQGHAGWRGSRQLAPFEGFFFIAAMGEMLARFDNTVTLSPTVRDRWEIPVPHIRIAVSENERLMEKDQVAMLGELLCEAKLVPTGGPPDRAAPLGMAVHELGTARMGASPNSSILNKYNQCWDMPNLFITDGSCFVTSGWQHPALTMMAITVRASRFILDELKRQNL